MPSQQQQKKKKKSSKPGYSQTTAITLDTDDDDSNSGSELGGPAAAPRGNHIKASTSSTRTSLRNRTKASAPAKQALKATSVPVVSSKRTHEEITSDSDDYSSDAIFVATSRATAIDKGKGKQRETGSSVTTGKAETSSNKVGNWIAAQKSTSKKQGKSSIMQVDGETDSSIERLPTPESLITEDSEPAGPPKRLLKADRTPLKKRSADNPHASSSSAVKGPGFLERLESNIRPQFSKTFKGKVRSTNSTSIPLVDDRFRSDEDDEDYESEDRPSPRKKTVKKHTSPAKKSSPKKTASSSQAIDIDDSDSEDAQLQPKRPASQFTILDSSSDGDLPNLPGPSTIPAPSGSSARKSSQFKENLEELNKRRRLSDKKSKSKKKHANRVVATPSPSPEPVKVVASRPAASSPLATTSSARMKQRINIRAISSKGKSPKKKMPMFRAPSDDSDLASDNGAAHASETDEEVAPARKRKGDKGKKVLKRKAMPSSSSSSSSSSESSAPDDDEMSEVEEDIALDFDPVVKDKLRPKDNSKAHRLDKLKQARAAKEMREEKRRRGIIDSDDDEKVKTAKAAREEEEDDDDEGDETDASSAGGVENFIVEDDGDIDPDELDRVQRMMPTQFSKHGALPLKDHFRIFVASVVFRYFLPKSKHYREKAEFTFSQLQVQNTIDGLINGSIASSIWNADFREALDQRPELAMHKIALTSGCDGCSKYDRTASEQAIVSGKPYDHDTLLDDVEEEEDPPQTFDLGRFCAEKAYFHHSLKHFLKHAADAIRAECRRNSTLGSKLMGDKDDRKEQREKEASRLVDIVSSENFPLQQRLWGELDQLMERAKHKYLK